MPGEGPVTCKNAKKDLVKKIGLRKKAKPQLAHAADKASSGKKSF